MKFKREIRAVFLAVTFITLSCPGGFAEMDVGGGTSLGGYISLGGGWLSDQPRHMNRDYLKKYLPFPQGFLADADLALKSKDGLEYYNFRMSHPGLRDQDYLLQIGKIGVYRTNRRSRARRPVSRRSVQCKSPGQCCSRPSPCSPRNDRDTRKNREPKRKAARF